MLMILVFIGLEISLGLVLKYSSWGKLHACLSPPLLNYSPFCQLDTLKLLKLVKVSDNALGLELISS
jgi:hypothetical protein